MQKDRYHCTNVLAAFLITKSNVKKHIAGCGSQKAEAWVTLCLQSGNNEERRWSML